jgi:hypothetical protein
MKKRYQTILFLGAGKIQIKSILSAKKAGFKIIGVDKNFNSKAKKICNHFINVDCKKINFIFDKLKKLKYYNIINVWANNDILLESKYKLEKKLKIKPDLHISKIKSLVNKSKFKIMFKKYSINETKEKYPLIAKPKLGHGSLGIKIIRNKKDFLKINYKKNYIFEKYINNLSEYGVNFFF